MIFEGTKNVLDAAIAVGVRRFVYMSSLTVHGEKEFFGADETTPRVNPPFYYGQAKNMAEDYLEEAYRAGKIETIVIRPGYIIFGENDFTGIYQVLENIKLGRFGYINWGKALCTFIYVQNLVDGIIHVGSQPQAAGESFVISDVTMSWKEYTELLCSGIGASPPTFSVPYWLIFPVVWIWEKLWRLFKVKKPPLLTVYRLSIQRRNWDFNGNKIIEQLGFQPRYSFDEGMQNTFDWYSSISQSPVKHPFHIKKKTNKRDHKK